MLNRRCRPMLLAATVAVTTVTACGPQVVEAGPEAPARAPLVDVVVSTVTTVEDTPDVTASPGAGSTSATVAPSATAGAWAPGVCLVWEQSQTEVIFETVACTEPHLVEVTGPLDLSEAYPDGADVPAAGALSTLAASRCDPLAAAYLGRALDGETGGIILPSVADWDAGERTAWCTVGLARVDGKRPSYQGSLRDAR